MVARSAKVRWRMVGGKSGLHQGNGVGNTHPPRGADQSYRDEYSASVRLERER